MSHASFQLDRRSLVLAALSGTLSSCAGLDRQRGKGAVNVQWRRNLDAKLDAAAASFGTVGHSVAILKRTELVYERHAGLADCESGVPISRSSVYPIFSISKLFLLIALYQSAEKGEIDLDMAISAIRPNLPTTWRAVTLRQAISHISGLPDYMPDNIRDTADDAFEAIRDQPLRFLPGSGNDYNQTNFLLAREALERASGRSLVDVVAAQFDKAAMAHSQYALFPARIDGLVKSYRPASDRRQPPVLYEMPTWPSYTFGSSGIVTTLADLVSWCQSLLAGDFLPFDVLRKYWRPQSLSSGADAWHANGWHFERRDRLAIVGHEGGNRVLLRHFFNIADPSDSVTVIYLDNGGRTFLNRFRLARLLADGVFPGAAAPTDAFEETLFQNLAAGRQTEAFALLAAERARIPASELEAAVNRVGYDAMYGLEPLSALLPFRFNVNRFPTSSNAHDSLGEAYRTIGNLPASRENYARALELDPGNKRIEAALRDIDAEIAARR